MKRTLASWTRAQPDGVGAAGVLLSQLRRGAALARDAANRVRYGSAAPRYAERVWVRANECQWALPKRAIVELTGLDASAVSGLVVRRAWPVHRALVVTEVSVIRACREHWINGVPWEQTGRYEAMLRTIAEKGEAEGCRSMEDIVRRYRMLDDLFDQAKSSGRLATRQEVNPHNFREQGGPLVHIGPDGTPFFGCIGFHRFAIAHVLKLLLPAQLGCVHRDAIIHLSAYRRPAERAESGVSWIRRFG